MVRVIRIISVAIFALAVFLTGYSAVFGLGKDSKIEEFIKQPGAVEKFTADKDKSLHKDENQFSPLVKEAAALSEVLNPPPPPPAVTVTQPSSPAPMAQTITPKFNLVGTSYYAGKPGASFALIDEPGQGLYWVKEGNSVGHLLIEKINDGSITLRDGSRTFEMNVTVKELWRDLIKGHSEKRPNSDTYIESQKMSSTSVPSTGVTSSQPETGQRSPTRIRQTDIAASRKASKYNQRSVLHELPKQELAIQQIVELNQPPQITPVEQSASIAALKETLKKQISEAKTSRVSTEEAKQMEELAEALKRLELMEQQDINNNQ